MGRTESQKTRKVQAGLGIGLPEMKPCSFWKPLRSLQGGKGGRSAGQAWRQKGGGGSRVKESHHLRSFFKKEVRGNRKELRLCEFSGGKRSERLAGVSGLKGPNINSQGGPYKEGGKNAA